jgi:hypothetical protein
VPDVGCRARTADPTIASSAETYFLTTPFTLFHSVSIPGLLRHGTNDRHGFGFEGDALSFVQATTSPAVASQQGLQVVTRRLYVEQFTSNLSDGQKTRVPENINSQASYSCPRS